MSWNTTMLFVEGFSLDQLMSALSGSRTLVTRDADWYSSAFTLPVDDCAIAAVGRWGIVCNPGMSAIGDAMMRARAKGYTMLRCVLSGVTSMYGFTFYRDGALVRSIMYVDGEPVDEFGEMLEQESGMTIPEWGPDEDYVLTMIQGLTGIEFSMLETASFIRLAPIIARACEP